MQERQVDLEPAVRVMGREVIPIVWTVAHRVERPGAFMAIMSREAIGVIVCDQSGSLAFMTDGRELSIEQLLFEYPSLADKTFSL